MTISKKLTPHIHFDTELFKFFEKGKSERELPNWKLRFDSTLKKNSYWEQWVDEVELWHKEKNGSWKSFGKQQPVYFSKSWLTGENWKRRNSEMTPSLIRSLREEIEEVYNAQRRARNRKLATERKQRDEALAKAKGVTVEDIVFERTSSKAAKRVEKVTEEGMKQLKLAFAYAKYLDDLQKEIDRCRAIIESPDIHRLKLRAGEEGLRDRVDKCIITMGNYFQQIPEEESKKTK